jgi:hypothetical protein
VEGFEMAKFVLLYKHLGEMGETPEAHEAAMNAWMGWFGSLGESVVDGGNPFGTAGSVGPDGSTSEGNTLGLGGYSIITAEDLAGAQSAAKGCPVLADGGSVEVFEAMPMG